MRLATLLGLPIGVILFGACQSATAIVVEVTTDAACADVRGTQISTGSASDLETRLPSSSTTACDPSSKRIGSLVIVPNGSNDAEVAIRVVVGIGQSPDLCVPPNYSGGCIVSRRVLRFTPHETLHLDVPLDLSCKDVPCGQTTTCKNGTCVPATIDHPDTCTEPGGCNTNPGVDASTEAGLTDAAFADATTIDAAISDTGDASLSAECKGTAGPLPVRISASIAGAKHYFCIDSTEVTAAQYAEFLKSGPVSQGDPCAWNSTFVPKNGDATYWPVELNTHPNRPVANVDWCDADAYCKWAGKRLCGTVPGGLAIADTARVSSSSEMFVACTFDSTRVYPYGATYDPQACNGGANTTGANKPVDVGSLTKCQGGFPGLYDLSGNVAEWLNSCSGTLGQNDTCYQGGGGADGSTSGGTQAELRCDNVANASDGRDGQYPDLGIRCCSDAR